MVHPPRNPTHDCRDCVLALQVHSRRRERLLGALILAWKGAAMVTPASLRLAELAAASKARRLLAEGFGSWHGLGALRQRQGAAVACFAQRAVARRAAAAFAEWREQVQRARLQQGRLEQFMQRCARVA